jgi:manganese/zinc/iron transport system ATP- binding protein
VPDGTLMAIVGPNGAGKTTLIKAILGLIEPAAGQVLIYGRPYAEQRRLVGYVPQRGSVDWDFPTSVLDVVMMGRYGHLGWLRRPASATPSSPSKPSPKSAWPTTPGGRSAS